MPVLLMSECPDLNMNQKVEVERTNTMAHEKKLEYAIAQMWLIRLRTDVDAICLRDVLFIVKHVLTRLIVLSLNAAFMW